LVRVSRRVNENHFVSDLEHACRTANEYRIAPNPVLLNSIRKTTTIALEHAAKQAHVYS